MTRKASSFSLARRPLATVLPLLLLGLSAAPSFAADSQWVPTATRAFIPSIVQTPAPAHSSTAQLQTDLLAASRGASPVANNAAQLVTVVVTLKPQHTRDLDNLLAQRLDGHPLPPLSASETVRRFSPTQQQVDAVVQHLQQAGLSQISVAPNRLLIEATGPASAIQAAFHTGLNTFQYQGRQVISNTDDAQVPASLADTVQAVVGLQTAVEAHTLYHRIQPLSKSAGTARTAASNGVGPHQLGDFLGIYQASGLPAASDTAVGIITAYDLGDTLSNLQQYASDHQLTAPPVRVIKTSSGTYANNVEATGEWSLDTQAVTAVGGGVKELQLYNAKSLADSEVVKAINAAVSAGSARVVSISLGNNEAAAYADGSLASNDTSFKLAVAQGQTFSVSSGDAGVYEADNGQIDFVLNPSSYTVSSPASSPYVVAIGGTQVTTSGNTTYVGEVVWNEGLGPGRKLWATGGGISKYESTPGWQSAALSSSLTQGKRVLPDFSFDASGASGAIIYDQGGYGVVGGTSIAAPVFAALWARLQTAHANNLGFAATELYPLVKANPTVVHDVVSGNNGYNGYGYKAAPGWDYPTGWGSLNIGAINSLLQASR